VRYAGRNERAGLKKPHRDGSVYFQIFGANRILRFLRRR
jgi:hypothetical protein